ncbi:MAG TPA: hypothetical protein VI603_18970 [Saprospiraceae bacterium]|nr:hypothetical protein [Saprospiraceae bacterium]
MKETRQNTIAAKIAAQPLFQAAIIFVLVAFLALIDRGSNVSGVGTSTQNSPWILMTACILFYALCSSILSLKAKQANRYWRDAILSFVLLMVASAATATVLSGQSMDEAGSFRWLFVVMSVGYLVFLTIVRLMKKIVDLAIRQDDKLRGE